MCVYCEINAITKELRAAGQKRDDSFSLNLSESMTRDFKIFGQKWGDSQIAGSPGEIVSYSFASQNFANQFGRFDSFITNSNFQTEITGALSAWENVADIKFIEEIDNADADIRFGWREIDGNGGILGQTTVPVSGALDSVIVALDFNEDWFLFGDAPDNQIDFSSTVLHEIGHAIGIDHSESGNALMNASYSTVIFDLQQDDIDAARSIYGENEIVRIDVHRFYNPIVGGHFFTSDTVEKEVVTSSVNFNSEGVGFEALSRSDVTISGSVPVYRFYNKLTGSHFFTSSEEEKDSVLNMESFNFEGIGFRAFDADSSSTVPIYRFFNSKTGGHFFTASVIEKDAVMSISEFRYEGEAFFAFADMGL